MYNLVLLDLGHVYEDLALTLVLSIVLGSRSVYSTCRGDMGGLVWPWPSSLLQSDELERVLPKQQTLSL